ncbi:LOB domain-containing protein 1-like [Punica granatum]|uniref:LOB domain-containing protein n=2 Tax=Punica granatum TaxID=22663 RepID=A0A218WC98_PUNGR|nr:LOB domain-containing protein 1-like [Punica granatum]OWM70153.1 hypothetical protein CDL15_Pgr026003 [Punica granatum]PKI43276.1 hypothetical protein CRG98_036362 [Punica granatum]
MVIVNAENIPSAPIHPPPPPASSPPPTSAPTALPLSTSPPASNNSSAVPVVISPCAACKILRRRCIDKCVLAPYFPPTDPYKFTIAHRVFGAANIIKLLQELPESQRADAVISMVYEANARLRDPVYGCSGTISRLQKQISELQAELAKMQAESVNIQCQNSHLLALLCMEMAGTQQAGDPTSNCNNVTMHQQQQPQQQQYMIDTSGFLDDSSLSSGWETLWGA